MKVTSFLEQAKVAKLKETMAKHGASRCVRMMNVQTIKHEENKKEKKNKNKEAREEKKRGGQKKSQEKRK